MQSTKIYLVDGFCSLYRFIYVYMYSSSHLFKNMNKTGKYMMLCIVIRTFYNHVEDCCVLNRLSKHHAVDIRTLKCTPTLLRKLYKCLPREGSYSKQYYSSSQCVHDPSQG